MLPDKPSKIEKTENLILGLILKSLSSPYQIRLMILQDPQIIRQYQKITDGMVDLWRRRYSFEEIRLYLDGYIACLRNTDIIPQYLIHRLEEQAMSFLRDPSNFELSYPQTQMETETDRY